MPLRKFAGSDYVAALDDRRLNRQYDVILNLMKDGQWRTLEEIKSITGYPESSISAQLRHARKVRFGNNTLNKRARGERKHGLFEYQLIVNKG